MVSNVEITGREMIKPSFPTPQNLRNLRLSFLDQIIPPLYTCRIFFYRFTELSTSNHAEAHQSLKQSLSKVLTRFYPLAGRLNIENCSIDCNDSGALWIEAKVCESNFSKVIEDPKMDEVEQFLPLGPTGRSCPKLSEANTLVLAVQVNVFDCGGVAIAVQIAHSLADGTSFLNFMNAWASACRGEEDTEFSSPRFDLAESFPPVDLSRFDGILTKGTVQKQKTVAKRFIFNKKMISSLKLAISSASGSQMKDPSRVEAVSAFIWMHFIDVVKAKDPKRSVAISHVVSLRPRMDPPLSPHTFGNEWRNVIALPIDDDIEANGGLCNLATDLRNAFRNINVDYIKNLQYCGDEYFNHLQKVSELKEKQVEFCWFTSSCGFPTYEVDFGWGKPDWACTATVPIKNLVVLTKTRCGEGVEAWINVAEEDATDDILTAKINQI